MPEDLKKLESLDYKPENQLNTDKDTKCQCVDCKPNQNLMIIEEIEGLISQVNEKLNKINIQFTTENPKPWQAKDLALEEIDLFQKTTLFELRKAFE